MINDLLSISLVVFITVFLMSMRLHEEKERSKRLKGELDRKKKELSGAKEMIKFYELAKGRTDIW